MSDSSARLAPDGATVILELERWTGTLPVSELRAQIAFYKGLPDRKDGEYAASYAPTVEALERPRRRVETGGAPLPFTKGE